MSFFNKKLKCASIQSIYPTARLARSSTTFLLPDGRAFLAVGDACNEGTPAAGFMVRTLTILHSEASAPGPLSAGHPQSDNITLLSFSLT